MGEGEGVERMSRESHNGSLPRGFTEWMRLYEKFNWSEIKPNELLTHEQYWIDGYFKWEYTQDYLKARCFDEIMAVTYTIEDLSLIASSLYHCAYTDHPAKYKTEKLLKLGYEKGNIERMKEYYTK